MPTKKTQTLTSTTLTRLGSLFPMQSRILIYILTGVLVLFAAGAVKDWYFPGSAAGDVAGLLTRPQSQLTLQTKVVRDAPTRVVERPVLAPDLTERQEKKLAERFSLDLNTNDLLTSVEIPRAPDGGEAAVTLDSDGQVDVTFRPNRPKFFDLGGSLEVGGGVVLNSRGQGFRLHAEKDLLRAGRMYLNLEGNLDLVGGETDASGALLLVYRR